MICIVVIQKTSTSGEIFGGLCADRTRIPFRIRARPYQYGTRPQKDSPKLIYIFESLSSDIKVSQRGRVHFAWHTCTRSRQVEILYYRLSLWRDDGRLSGENPINIVVKR